MRNILFILYYSKLLLINMLLICRSSPLKVYLLNSRNYKKWNLKCSNNKRSKLIDNYCITHIINYNQQSINIVISSYPYSTSNPIPSNLSKSNHITLKPNINTHISSVYLTNLSSSSFNHNKLYSIHRILSHYSTNQQHCSITNTVRNHFVLLLSHSQSSLSSSVYHQPIDNQNCTCCTIQPLLLPVLNLSYIQLSIHLPLPMP